MVRDKRLPQIKTAVLVKDLIAAIERRRDVELKADAAETAAYPAKMTKYIKEVKAHLRSCADQLTVDFKPPRGRWGHRDFDDWVKEEMPDAPSAPSPKSAACIRAKYDNLVVQLKMSAEPKVRLSVEDFRKFMTGDAEACVC